MVYSRTMTERSKKSLYDEKYIRENVQKIALNLNRRTESDLIEWLNAKTNRNGYIKGLIREDIERHRKQP